MQRCYSRPRAGLLRKELVWWQLLHDKGVNVHAGPRPRDPAGVSRRVLGVCSPWQSLESAADKAAQVAVQIGIANQGRGVMVAAAVVPA